MSAVLAQDNGSGPSYIRFFGYRVATKPLLAVAIATALAVSVAQSSPTMNDSATHHATVALSHDVNTHPAQAHSAASMNFEANRGQWGPSIRYAARGQRYSIAYGVQETLIHAEDSNATAALRFRGGNPAPVQEALKTTATQIDHLHSLDRSRWLTGSASDVKVAYRNVYPGIDTVFYANQKGLEYEFVVTPGADPALIAFEFRGADSVHITADGDIAFEVAGETLTQKSPVAYQEIAGQRRYVQSHYIIRNDHTIRFELSNYDNAQTLYIDPVISYIERAHPDA